VLEECLKSNFCTEISKEESQKKVSKEYKVIFQHPISNLLSIGSVFYGSLMSSSVQKVIIFVFVAKK
jgi:hypothetical protein